MSGRTPGAAAFLERLVDPGTFEPWDVAAEYDEGLAEAYRAQLARARERSGTDEAVVTGRAVVGGQPVALVVSDFNFLGGSIGVATSHRITAAVHRATALGLPLLAAPASGGTRMQEGTPAFVEMLSITRAVEAHKAAGLPYLVYLRHPTTGGVMASWASLGHLSLAEPGALLGFLGPVVYEALHEQPFPAGVQVAENLCRQGLVDDVVSLDELPAVIGRTLDLLVLAASGARGQVEAPRAAELAPTVTHLDAADAWLSVQETRRTDRPGVRDLLRHTARNLVWLHGRHGEDALVVVLADLAGQCCLLIGQDRAAADAGRSLSALQFRLVRRALRTAEQLRVPVLTVIDTPGAELSVAAEESGLAEQIAGCLADLTSLHVPSVAILLGQGTGGAALALFGADRVVAAQHAWLAPLPPEGASALMTGSVARADDLARRQRIGAHDLQAAGLVHAVVAEDPPAHVVPSAFCRDLVAAAVGQLNLPVCAPRQPSAHHLDVERVSACPESSASTSSRTTIPA